MTKNYFKKTWTGIGLTALLTLSSNAFAQTCMNDIYNQFGQGGDLNCTANDVSLASATAIVLDDGCTSPNDTVTLELSADVTLTAQARYDLGFYFAEDGGDALSGSCQIKTLPVDPDPPFINLDTNDMADICGDIDAAHSPMTAVNLGQITVACTDVDGDGKLEIPSCTSWRQPGRNESCDAPIDAFPGTPSKCRCAPIDVDNVVVPPYEPGVEITKEPNLQTIPQGASATFTITVRNTGNTELTNVVVGDQLSPSCAAVFQTIAVMEEQSYTCTVDDVVDGFTNVATVTTDEDVSDEDDAIVEVQIPLVSAIEIVKGPELQIIPENGEAIFTISVTNIGDTPLTNVIVSDALAPDCNETVPLIPVRGNYTYGCTLSNVTSGFTNVATVTTNEGVGDDDDAVVEVQIPEMPGVEIIKGPETQTIQQGGTATFTITVRNTGDTELTNVVVGDQLSPSCAAQFPTIAVMEEQSYTCTVENVTDGFTNVATVTTDEGVGDEDDAVVEVQIPLTPSVEIEKSPDLQIIPQNADAVFTITVRNTGDTPLTNVVVADPLAPNCDATIPLLTVFQSQSYNCTISNVTSGFTNVATVTTDEDVSDEDEAVVEVQIPLMPSVEIVKAPDSQVIPHNADAVFTITVRNTGDTPLTNVIVSDPLAPNCDATIPSLAVFENYSYNCTLSNVTSSFTNVATVSTDEGVGDDDDAAVTVDPKQCDPKLGCGSDGGGTDPKGGSNDPKGGATSGGTGSGGSGK